MAQINDMTVGSPSRGILKFAIPIILGYILQQMYQVIDAVIVGRWVGVNGLAAVGASTSVMFIIMGFCNGSCAGFAIPVAQAFGAKDFRKMRCYVANAVRIAFWMAIDLPLLAVSCHSLYDHLQPSVGFHPCAGRFEAAVLFPHRLGVGQYPPRRRTHHVHRDGSGRCRPGYIVGAVVCLWSVRVVYPETHAAAHSQG